MGDCPDCEHPLDDCQCPPPTDAEAVANLQAGFPGIPLEPEEAVPQNG